MSGPWCSKRLKHDSRQTLKLILTFNCQFECTASKPFIIFLECGGWPALLLKYRLAYAPLSEAGMSYQLVAFGEVLLYNIKLYNISTYCFSGRLTCSQFGNIAVTNKINWSYNGRPKALHSWSRQGDWRILYSMYKVQWHSSSLWRNNPTWVRIRWMFGISMQNFMPVKRLGFLQVVQETIW